MAETLYTGTYGSRVEETLINAFIILVFQKAPAASCTGAFGFNTVRIHEGIHIDR